MNLLFKHDAGQREVGARDRKCTYSATNAIQLDVMRLLLQIYVCLEPIMIARLIEMCSQNVAIFLLSVCSCFAVCATQRAP